MKTGVQPVDERGPGMAMLRWIVCLVLVMAVHAGAVEVLLHRHAAEPDALPPAPEAVLLELAPSPAPASEAAPERVPAPSAAPPALPEVSQDAPPAPLPPLPEPPQSQDPVVAPPVPTPTPIPEPTPEPTPEPDAVLPTPPRPVPPPRVVPRKVLPRVAPRAVAVPPQAPPQPIAPTTPAAPAAAPSAAAVVAAPSNAVPNWRSELVGKLARAKRYPEGARSRGEQGTVLATFTMDRLGHVLSASVTRGAGSYQLDEEAVALIHRAEPLPALPPEMAGATITLTVPIAFSLR